MVDFGSILKDLEGAIAPDALKAIEDKLRGAVSAAEQEFTQAAEEKYGVPPAVVSDVEKAVQDAVPAAAKRVEDALPPNAADIIHSLTSQLSALQAQVTALRQAPAQNQPTTMGQGDPVTHTLFLENGTIVKDHPGVATHYSVDNGDGTDTVMKVIAAYPTS